MTPSVVSYLGAMLVSLILAASFVSGASSAESELRPAQKDFLKKLDEPIILRGDYFKAVMVVYEDFSHRLAENEAAAKSATGGNPELSQWLSKIEHYDIHVEQNPSSYIVQIGPTIRGDAPTVFGGGARYVIDRKSFEITEKVMLK
jgi:hypothetical protein